MKNLGKLLLQRVAAKQSSPIFFTDFIFKHTGAAPEENGLMIITRNPTQ